MKVMYTLLSAIKKPKPPVKAAGANTVALGVASTQHNFHVDIYSVPHCGTLCNPALPISGKSGILHTCGCPASLLKGHLMLDWPKIQGIDGEVKQ